MFLIIQVSILTVTLSGEVLLIPTMVLTGILGTKYNPEVNCSPWLARFNPVLHEVKSGFQTEELSVDP